MESQILSLANSISTSPSNFSAFKDNPIAYTENMGLLIDSKAIDRLLSFEYKDILSAVNSNHSDNIKDDRISVKILTYSGGHR